ncbi:MAG: argininosuccinate lyase [Kiritimatiellaeota bacterium]|nr:argininosuccinate lyase [Kiritimatiellota bacterium]
MKTTVGDIDADILAFTVGKDPLLDVELVEWDCVGSAAHATMLAAMTVSPPILTKAQCRAVIRELGRIVEASRRGEFVITEADQDVHLAVERTLTERLGDLGKRIHTGRSRNDQVALDLRLYGRHHLFGVLDETLTLAETLLAFARVYRRLPMVGRTHFQPAMPSSVGLWASAHAESLIDDCEGLFAALALTNRNPLGSAAGYGVPLPIDRALTTRLLGFDAPVHNVLYASNTRGKIESVTLSSLASVMLTLSRLAEDVILYASPEFNYFAIPKPFCTGSSIMPQKYNPDVCELIRAKAARLIGHATAAATIVKALPGGYNRDLQETKELYLDGFRVTRSCLRILIRMIPGLEPLPEYLRKAFTPDVFATDRALELVAAGVPFRDAYHEVRDNLESLGMMNPDKAIAAKTHLGATAGLDFAAYAKTISRARRRLAIPEAKATAAMTALLK